MEIMKGERRHEKRRCQDDESLVVMVTFWRGGGECFVKVVFVQGCETKVSTQLVVAGGLGG